MSTHLFLCSQVLFFDQVRNAVNGGVLLSDQPRSSQQSEYGEEISLPEANNGNHTPSATGDVTWETMHQDFTALKGDLACIKMRIAEAETEREPTPQYNAASIKHHVKAKGVLSALKPEKLFSKLFASRGFSGSETSRDSVTPEVTAEKVTVKHQPRHRIA